MRSFTPAMRVLYAVICGCLIPAAGHKTDMSYMGLHVFKCVLTGRPIHFGAIFCKYLPQIVKKGNQSLSFGRLITGILIWADIPFGAPTPAIDDGTDEINTNIFSRMGLVWVNGNWRYRKTFCKRGPNTPGSACPEYTHDDTIPRAAPSTIEREIDDDVEDTLRHMHAGGTFEAGPSTAPPPTMPPPTMAPSGSINLSAILSAIQSFEERMTGKIDAIQTRQDRLEVKMNTIIAHSVPTHVRAQFDDIRSPPHGGVEGEGFEGHAPFEGEGAEGGPHGDDDDVMINVDDFLSHEGGDGVQPDDEGAGEKDGGDDDDDGDDAAGYVFERRTKRRSDSDP